MPFSSLFNRKSSRKNNQQKDKSDPAIKAKEQNSSAGVNTKGGAGVNFKCESDVMPAESTLSEAAKPEESSSEVAHSADERSERAPKVVHNAEEQSERAPEIVHSAEERSERAPEVVLSAEERSERAPEVVLSAEEQSEGTPKVVHSAEKRSEKVPEVVHSAEQRSERAPEVVLSAEERSEGTPKVVLTADKRSEGTPEVVLSAEERSEGAPKVVLSAEERSEGAPEVVLSAEERSERAPEVLHSADERSETLQGDIQTTDNAPKTLTDVVQTRQISDSDVEVKSSDTLNMQNANLNYCCKETLQHSEVSVCEEKRILDVDHTENDETSPAHGTRISKSQNGNTSEQGDQQDSGQLVEQDVSEVEIHDEGNGERDRKDINLSEAGVNTNDLPQKEAGLKESCKGFSENEGPVMVDNTNCCHINTKTSEISASDEQPVTDNERTSFESATGFSETKNNSKESKIGEPLGTIISSDFTSYISDRETAGENEKSEKLLSVIEREKTEDDNNLKNRTERIKGTSDNANGTEYESIKQELDIGSSLEPETILYGVNETSGGDGSTGRSLCAGTTEHKTGEGVLKAEEDAIPLRSSASASPTVTSSETTEIQRDMDMDESHRGRSEIKHADAEDKNSVNEGLDLLNTEGNGLSTPPDSRHEVDGVESMTSLEDSFDFFPSECDEFSGGQRKMMAYEQHPTPSWKVGYLQVKLPVKSRGRGKLKVWRQRWVVIQMDEFVKDTKNPSLMINIYASECSNARRHSALFWCTISANTTVIYRSQSRTHRYAFSVSADNDVILHLAADSETASQEWMTAIRNLLWPPSPVLQLEKVLHGSDFEVSVIDNEFSFHAGLLGTYGNMKVTSNKLILSHPQTDHVIQEWYLNTLDKFQLLPQNKEEDAFKVVVMHTGQDSSTGSGQIIIFCSEAVTMLQSIASTIHKLLQYRTTAGKDHNQKELADLADWLSPAMSQPMTGEPQEDYYKVPRRQIRSLLDIPNFSFEKPLSSEGHQVASSKSSILTSSTSASTFSQDSGISMATQPDDFLNCSVTSFTIGGRPVRDHTSSESSDAYSPPCTPEIHRKKLETEMT